MTQSLNSFLAMESFAPLQYFRRLFSEAYDPRVVLVELLLIGAVVYAVLRFLQGTRGARLLRGIAVILIISFIVVRMLAEQFAWERIQYLYQYFLGAVFLTAIVVFQPELRRGLMRIGERLWVAMLYKTPERIIEPIVTAAASMSKKRIGALIAIERATSLAPIIETGVPLEAQVSSELLATIFWPGSALHDMGVVISQGLITAAACQFPLADSEDLERSLGSRHRAALGLSEESDAAIVVVSEETGILSVACEGKLIRHLNPEALRIVLQRLLGGKEETEESSELPAIAPEGQSVEKG